MREMGNDAYVYKRDNGEYGLSQIWPIKLNAQFKKSLLRSCARSTPNQPQPPEHEGAKSSFVLGALIKSVTQDINRTDLYMYLSLAFRRI